MFTSNVFKRITLTELPQSPLVVDTGIHNLFKCKTSGLSRIKVYVQILKIFRNS